MDDIDKTQLSIRLICIGLSIAGISFAVWNAWKIYKARTLLQNAVDNQQNQSVGMNMVKPPFGQSQQNSGTQKSTEFVPNALPAYSENANITLNHQLQSA